MREDGEDRNRSPRKYRSATRVPPEKVVPDYPLDGRAYVFVMYGVIQCLVRPRGGL